MYGFEVLRLVANSGLAETLEFLLWTGIFHILPGFQSFSRFFCIILHWPN